ncbi:MAG TPA: lipopolysaccharide heptosyltransferase II [Candidatus Sulfotelmatobacter sp.]|nr:lipopolysaccharide heptosyltransferase II [Candidatus Sulfotelmatobacter sp.]
MSAPPRGVPTRDLPAHPEAVRRILVRAPTWLGDAVLSLPVLEGLRRTFPRAEVVVSAKPTVADLFALVPGLAAVVPDAGRGPRGLLATARRLRRERCDVAVALPNSFASALLARLAGVPHRVGYARDGRSPLLTAAVPVPAAAARWHQVDRYRALLGALGWDEGERRPALTVPEAGDAAERLLAGILAAPGRPLVAVAPGASYGGAKRWAPERFAAAADRLARELGAAIAVVGSRGEAGEAAAVARRVAAPVVNLAGRTTLPELGAVLARCTVLLSNDSGAMHVAAAVGAPVVAVFGPTQPAATGPLGRAAILRHPVACSPCRYRACPIGHPCMDGVTPEAVAAAARGLLAAGDPPAEARWVGGPRPVVFLDRDGTVNEEAGYLRDPADLKLIPGAVEALGLLRGRGFALVVVSNQAGVARGLMTEADVAAVNAGLARQLAGHGTAPDAFYFCPHHADHGAPPYRRACTCRKPGAGMLLQAAREHGLDLTRAVLIGDHWTDVQAARRLGLPAALVLTGHGAEEWERHRGETGDAHVAADILAAARWIVEGPR